MLNQSQSTSINIDKCLSIEVHTVNALKICSQNVYMIFSCIFIQKMFAHYFPLNGFNVNKLIIFNPLACL